ncbi:MAG: hypothetical protein ACYCUM_11410 [Solirubrobacteraceae bacterium]
MGSLNSVKRLPRFRDELVKAGVPAATAIKTMTLVQSMLTFAVSEEIIEYDAGRAVPKPAYERAPSAAVVTANAGRRC